MYSGASQYATISDCNTVPSSFSNVIKYSFTVLSNCAVYVAHVVTATTAGLHVSLNVYVYCAVAVFVGVVHE